MLEASVEAHTFSRKPGFTTIEGNGVFDDLAGKVVVSARGLGFSMARALARQGVALSTCSTRSRPSAARVAEESGVETVGVTADVTSHDDVAAALLLGSPAG